MNTLSSGHAASDSGGISTINSIESKALTSVAKNSPATPPSNEVKKSVSGPNFENTSQGNVISIDVQVKLGSLSSIDAIGPVNVSVGTQSSKNSIPTLSNAFLRGVCTGNPKKSKSLNRQNGTFKKPKKIKAKQLPKFDGSCDGSQRSLKSYFTVAVSANESSDAEDSVV